MKDLRGVDRGACTKCTCTSYLLEKGATRAACAYCECPAPAHVDISAGPSPKVSSPIESQGLSASSSFNSSISSIGATNEPICIQIPNSTELFLGDLLTRGASTDNIEVNSDEIETLFPKKFGKKVDEALKAKKVTATHKDAICRKIVDKLVENDKDSNVCLQKAARRIIKRYSPFKSPLPRNETAVYEKLKRRRNRLNLNEKQPGETLEYDTTALSPTDAKIKMQTDWAAQVRRIENYKENMIITRMQRKEDAKKMPGMQLMKHYPALGLPELVLLEFEEEMGVSKETMKRNWERALPNLIQYYKENKIPYLDKGTVAEKTLSILSFLHLVPVWKKDSLLDKRTTFVMEKFPANTPISEMRPGAKDPPRLIACGNIDDESLTIHCYFDTEPFFAVQDPVEAILLLLSTYFLFGIKWSGPTRLPTITLCCCTAGSLKVSLEVNRNNKLVDFLKRIEVM